jgi:signal transduction histidine kinase
VKEFGVSVAKIKYVDGQDSILVLLLDITDKMKVRELQVSGQVKTAMLCSVSHELRTPLNQVNGMLYLAEDK